MAMQVEVLIPTDLSPTGDLMLRAMCDAILRAGDQARITTSYKGDAEVLMLYGVGAADRAKAREMHVRSNRRVVLWDLGYFAREKIVGHLRCSINHDHPQAYLNATSDDPSRWNKLELPLRNDYNPKGPILLIGLGTKSRIYLDEPHWEADKLKELRRLYPDRRIIYRPKPGHISPVLNVETASTGTEIQTLLKGASLVICRHSNVACDAILQGIPFQAEDGAAMWLADKPYTAENRLRFLRKLAWWQYRAREAREAWQFLRPMVAL